MNAKFIKELPSWRGHAKLFNVSPPMKTSDGETEHVVVSKIDNEFGEETYIFASDSNGDVADFCELNGSQKGDISHEQILFRLGYQLA